MCTRHDTVMVPGPWTLSGRCPQSERTGKSNIDSAYEVEYVIPFNPHFTFGI